MRLPDGNGIALVKHIQEKFPQMPVAVITAFGNMETAIAALKAGPSIFVSKPLDLNDLRNIVRLALKVPHPAGTAVAVTPTEQAQIGKTAGRVARHPEGPGHDRKTGAWPGAGVHQRRIGHRQELAARLIHELGPRADKPFVPVNCGAIPETSWKASSSATKRQLHRRGAGQGGSVQGRRRRHAVSRRESATCPWPCR